jgi:hypothetical protein
VLLVAEVADELGGELGGAGGAADEEDRRTWRTKLPAARASISRRWASPAPIWTLERVQRSRGGAISEVTIATMTMIEYISTPSTPRPRPIGGDDDLHGAAGVHAEAQGEALPVRDPAPPRAEVARRRTCSAGDAEDAEADLHDLGVGDA